MNKKQCFQKLWNNIEDGWPEPDSEVKILIETNKGYSVTNGELLCAQLTQMENKEFEEKIIKQGNLEHTGYFCKRWMVIHL